MSLPEPPLEPSLICFRISLETCDLVAGPFPLTGSVQKVGAISGRQLAAQMDILLLSGCHAADNKDA